MKQAAYEQMYSNELNHAWYIGTRELLLDFMNKNIKKNAKILDVGCGTGGTLLLLKKYGYKNTFGVDASKLAIKFCKKRKLKNIVLGDINQLNFPEKTFGLLIRLDVIYHEGVNIKKAVNGIHRILKPDGLFYSQEPAFNILKGKHDVAIQTERRFSKVSLENIFIKSKYKRIKSTYYNFFLFIPILAFRLASRFKNEDSADSDVKKLPKFLNHIMLISLRIEKYIIKVINLPVGVSVVTIWKK